MKLLIALHHRFELWRAPEWFAQRLRQEFPRLEVVESNGYEHIGEEIADAEVMLGWSLRADQFAKAKKLRWIHSTAAAVHQLMSPQLAASDVVVTNARAVHAPIVAEHVIAMTLALAKRVPSAVRFQEKKIWAQEQIYQEQPREVEGSTLLLVGLGSIGKEVARRANGLGMKVLAVRQHARRGAENVESVFPPEELRGALALAHFVVLCVPLTPATEHIINENSLRAMRRDAFLINVGRGPLIDDAALIAALRAGQIAGAALDVFAEEPLPASSEYWKLENCLITPHTAAVTSKLWERHYVLFSQNLNHYLNGESLHGVVDKNLGY